MPFGRMGAEGGFGRLGVSGGGTGLRGDAYVNFATMSNGAPTTAATGQPIIRDPAGGAAAGIVLATVSNGALVAAASGQATTAAYTCIRLPEDVKSYYADVSFGDANDSAGMIIAGDALQAAIGYTSLHIIFTYNSWTLQYYSSGAPTTVQSGTNPAVPFNTKCRIGYRISGNDFVFLLTDGSGVTVNSVAAATRTNHCVIFEHYRGTTGAPGVKFYAVAANLFADPVAAGRTNLLVAPNNLANAAWTKNSFSGPTSVPPGEQLLETAVNDLHWAYQSLAKAAAQVRYSLRFKAKLVGRDWAKLVSVNGAGNAAQAQRFLNLTTGAYGTQSGTSAEQTWMIYPLSNGYSQVQVDFLSNSDAAIYIALGLATADTTDTYVGDITKGMITYDQLLHSRPT